MQEGGPSGKLTVLGEPQKPSKIRAFHGERGDEQTFGLWCRMVLEELGNLEAPPRGVRAIKVRHIEFHAGKVSN